MGNVKAGVGAVGWGGLQSFLSQDYIYFSLRSLFSFLETFVIRFMRTRLLRPGLCTYCLSRHHFLRQVSVIWRQHFTECCDEGNEW